MLRGPQALFSLPGNLCALFWMQAGERANPAHLAARLIDARLALPSECRMILIVGRKDEERQVHLLRRDFNLIVPTGDSALSAFLRDKHDLGVAKAPDRRTKEAVRTRFGIALTTSQRTFREARVRNSDNAVSSRGWIDGLEPQRSDVAWATQDYAYQPRNTFEAAAGSVSLLAASGRAGLARQLRNAADAHLLASWILDSGVPLPLPTSTHLAVATHGLELLRPREGLLTAAAFAGVAVSPTADGDLVDFAFQSAKRARMEDKEAERALLS